MQITQAKSILLQQQSEWSKVFAEESERQNYIQYGVIMTVIAHVAMFIGNAFIVSSITAFGGFGFGPGYFAVFEGIQAVLAVAMLYIVPQILAAVAPSFGGQNNTLSATKLYVFSMTPAWIGMMFGILPVIGWLGAIAGGIYGIYLFWQHVTEAMSVPEDKKVVYVIVAVLAIAVVSWVVSAIAHSIAGAMFVSSIVHPGRVF